MSKKPEDKSARELLIDQAKDTAYVRGKVDEMSKNCPDCHELKARVDSLDTRVKLGFKLMFGTIFAAVSAFFRSFF